MLAERVIEWTEQWKREGLEEGRRQGLQQGIEKGLKRGLRKGMEKGMEKGLEQVRGAFLRELERRFGPLPEDVRRRVDEIGSIQELTELGFRVGAASSIADLGLG